MWSVESVTMSAGCPSASPPPVAPRACKPARNVCSNSVRPVDQWGPAARTFRPRACQPLGVFELAEFPGRVDQYIGVGPDSETPPGRLERPCVEYTVTQVCLGDGAKADNRLAGRDTAPFRRRGVSRVDQAPVGIKGLAVEEPLDRTPARPLQAILHLADLARRREYGWDRSRPTARPSGARPGSLPGGCVGRLRRRSLAGRSPFGGPRPGVGRTRQGR